MPPSSCSRRRPAPFLLTLFAYHAPSLLVLTLPFPALHSPLPPSNTPFPPKHPPIKQSGIQKGSLKETLLLAIPSFFDLVATILMNIGLLSVTASVYQMMRGAEMLFAALFAVTFLHRHLNKWHYLGILCCGVRRGVVVLGCRAYRVRGLGFKEVGRGGEQYRAVRSLGRHASAASPRGVGCAGR